MAAVVLQAKATVYLFHLEKILFHPADQFYSF